MWSWTVIRRAAPARSITSLVIATSAVEGVGVAPGVVVGEDHRAGVQFQGAPHHLPGIDRGMVDGAVAHPLIGDQPVLLVEEQHPELLARGAREGGPQVGLQLAGGRDDGPLAQRPLQLPPG